MSKKPNDVINQLQKEDQILLGRILKVEENHLHLRDLKASSRTEKEIISAIMKEVDEAVKDEN